MLEIWKDIKGYEDVYQVSNLGNVYSVIRNKQLKPRENCYGYLLVNLCINGKHKTFQVHRLVAQSFIPNPDNKPEVNHLDEDKTNNLVDNLEWLTRKENNNYGTRNTRMAKANSKPIKVIYQDNTYEYWESATAFAKEFGIDRQNVCAVLRGRQKTAYRMKFEYLE